MTSKKQLRLAYGLAAIFFIVGIVSYAAFPAKEPENPVRLMFKSAAGNVLFDHKIHSDSSGYGLSCKDCHHHPEEDDADLRACGDCHKLPEKGEAVQKACTDCHDTDEIEGSEMMKRPEAFHAQCIDCHKEVDAGPQDCGLCHFMQ
jgi:class III cytochrome C family protein